MIDYKKARKIFEEYLQCYDLNDDKIKLKVNHTYRVVSESEFICRELELNEENVQLGKVIALFHDIGRFGEVKSFKHFVDLGIHDHGLLGQKILFDSLYIRNFIEDDKYDSIISKAIYNHNKYKIEDNLEENELLHSKIIRDADKLDNFMVKKQEKFKDIANISEYNLKNGYISKDVYDDFMNCKSILTSKRRTDLDFWVSILAFIFDINFKCTFKRIKEENYINILIDRINYENNDTKIKMEKIREFANDYINNRC